MYLSFTGGGFGRSYGGGGAQGYGYNSGGGYGGGGGHQGYGQNYNYAGKCIDVFTVCGVGITVL